jgi:hypothetical protein
MLLSFRMAPKIPAFEVPLLFVREWLLSHDKLYTVAAVVLIIWVGLAMHLWRLTKRIEKLERLHP